MYILSMTDLKTNFYPAFKVYQQEGNLAYEYNPFRNYRLQETMYEIDGILYTRDEAIANKLIPEEGELDGNVIIRQIGELVDLETDELDFDLNHPVSILPQYSYDGSVNLILNDGKNIPRLINSRFSATERSKYQIVDRKGDNDTNIYDQGEQFNVDTSLYKTTNYIPKLSFSGTYSSGNLPVGNYHFYFKYVDADGNESDFICESGLVSIFIGFDAKGIYSGFRNENSHKRIRFTLSELDPGYQYISVYYTRSTSDVNENEVTEGKKIMQQFLINSANFCNVDITGFEDTSDVPISDINQQYLVASAVEAQEECQNLLFFGNINKDTTKYSDLANVSLYFYPEIVAEEKYDITNKIDHNYEIQDEYENSFYNSKYIYEKTGYWNREIYRFGIVYILQDGTLSPVFNIRGINYNSQTEDLQFTAKSFYKSDGKTINVVDFDEESGLINFSSLENAKGTVFFDFKNTFDNHCNYGIKFNCVNEELSETNTNNIKNIQKYLQKIGIKGFFFVRQKRIPTLLAQAYVIGVDKQSHLPALPIKKEESEEAQYFVESFLNKGTYKQDWAGIFSRFMWFDRGVLDNEYQQHLHYLDLTDVNCGAICPEYDINSPYLNSLFTGDNFIIELDEVQPKQSYLTRDTYDERHYYVQNFRQNSSVSPTKVRIVGVEDNVKLVAIDDIYFSSRAGEAEEASKYEYIKVDTKASDSVNLARGSYGPYLGLTSVSTLGKIVNIRIPGYNMSNMRDYFNIRFNDASSFHAISDRFKISELPQSLEETFYRGDCYICQFTHRLNRNFQDPSSPSNDEIVDKNCWKDNYSVQDGVVQMEKFDKINLGDVNAVQLGSWITLVIKSSYNLNIRALDHSNVDEKALFGIPRGFFPYFPITAKGVFKIPEALCYNKGLGKSVSERYNFEEPNVPALKNDFSNRIAYSTINIQDSFKNGFRVFMAKDYRDYSKKYGSITKLVNLNNNLLCIFEHGTALIPVNERALAGEGSGGSVYINTSNVLPENPKILSDTFGSQWKESIIKTNGIVYGVDTIGKKIWRTNGETFECISDFKVQEFLNNNISLSERELTPIIGIRNVKTHYNKFKHDVMFTFYDNLYGFEEKIWNLCWNELTQRWTTFYSWVPSYSENIYNSLFSFDRNTSKQIAKLGISRADNNWSDGIVLTENIIPITAKIGDEIGKLSLANRNLPETSKNSNLEITYSLERDNYKNWDYFKLENGILYLNKDVDKLPSDVLLLNIKANIEIVTKENASSLEEAISNSFNNTVRQNMGQYESVVAVCKEECLKNLSSAFWKHGQAGIINISDPIEPTKWYGKVHAFEFEFIVADDPGKHKIFDSLEIISNKAAPESFHYEIVGECYDFAKDKENMYIRQEATKELYQYNGSNIVFDHGYKKLISKPRRLRNNDNYFYDKSTIFPLYYCRQDKINEIENSYHLFEEKEGYSPGDPNFSALAGAEIVRYPKLGEYRIWNHAKAVDITKEGIRRGNMQYKEDKWNVQINPINFVQNNETPDQWIDEFGDKNNRIVPAECNLFPPPFEISEAQKGLNLPVDWTRNIIAWKNIQETNKEVKMKDKFIKIRVRYSGEDLAIISAINTLYSISYA